MVLSSIKRHANFVTVNGSITWDSQPIVELAVTDEHQNSRAFIRLTEAEAEQTIAMLKEGIKEAHKAARKQEKRRAKYKDEEPF